MKKMSPVTKCAATAVCMALCVVLPLTLHAIPNGGKLFSPMHIPVLLCGLVCGWQYGLACGLAGPVLSSLLTSMPPMGSPTQYGMIIELAVYGLTAGLMMKFVHTKNQTADIYVSLVTAMLAGRIMGGLSKAFFFSAGTYTFGTWSAAYFTSGFPGIIVQLILIPVLYLALCKAHLVPVRYAK